MTPHENQIFSFHWQLTCLFKSLSQISKVYTLFWSEKQRSLQLRQSRWHMQWRTWQRICQQMRGWQKQTKNIKLSQMGWLNTLRPRQDGRHFPDDIFKRIFLNHNVRIPINISLEFVPTGPINNIPALVQIMAWRRPGDKPLSETMLVSLLTQICVIRPQWVN